MPNQLPYDDESALLAEVAKGSQAAFSILFDRYRNKLYSHALSYMKSCEEAEELVQDIFLKIWEHRQHLPEVKSFKNYLFILSRNQLVSAVRKKLKPAAATDGLEAGEHLLRPDSQLEWKEAHHRLQEGIERLSPQQRTVFTLSRFEHLTYEQISRRMQISPATVKFHMVAALNALREFLHYRPFLVAALPGLLKIFFG